MMILKKFFNTYLNLDLNIFNGDWSHVFSLIYNTFGLYCLIIFILTTICYYFNNVDKYGCKFIAGYIYIKGWYVRTLSSIYNNIYFIICKNVIYINRNLSIFFNYFTIKIPLNTYSILYCEFIRNELKIEYFKGILVIVLHLFRVVVRFPEKKKELGKEFNQFNLFMFMMIVSLFVMFTPLCYSDNNLILFSSILPSKLELKNIKLRLKVERLIKKIDKYIKSLNSDLYLEQHSLNLLIQHLKMIFKPSNNDQKLISAPYSNVIDIDRKTTVTTVYRSKYNKHIRLYISGINLEMENDMYKGNLNKLFDAITLNEDFKNLGPVKKVLIVGFNNTDPSIKRSLHQSVEITNLTTFKDYYKGVKGFIKQYGMNQEELESGFGFMVCNRFLVDVVDCSIVKDYTIKNKLKNKRNYSTSISITSNFVKITDPEPEIKNTIPNKNKSKTKKPSIKAIKKIKSTLSKFCTYDIETIIMDKTNIHIPIAVSTYCKDFEKLFLIDTKLLKEDSGKAVQQLFKDYLDFMKEQDKSYTIFAHNNGSYDGYFTYKNLINIVKDIEDLKCVVDDSNNFIKISYTFENIDEDLRVLTWKDSLRIFPGKLDDICKQFDVKGKVSEYDPAFNNIKLFEDKELLEKFKEYSMQDSKALYDALINAQKLYFDKYGIDVCDIVSTASLSFKIFRKHFLTKEIPLLTNAEDQFVRAAYLGGATDYYKAIGKKLYWYDINSLYPYAMLEPVPYKIIDKHNDLSNVKVSDFKGFVKARVTCPDNIVNPIVACKHEGRTIYPRGSWIGVYFADYLAKAETYGYKIELISGIEFEYTDLFSNYIKHFYEIKKTQLVH
jgi:hypothetical protein